MSHTTCVFSVFGVSPRLADLRLVLAAVVGVRELRPGPRGVHEPRLLFAFDPGRTAVILVAGTEEIDWTKRWYVDNVPIAHARYIQYLREGTEAGND